MNPKSCDQVWQVEAARDGRLDAEGRAAFAVHQRDCAVCQAEQRTFDRIASELAEVGAHIDEMAMRRLRQQTLELASERMQRPERSHAAIGWVMVACAAVIAVALFLVGRGELPGATRAAVLVEPEQNARWQRKLAQNVEQVELSEGTLLFRVARKPSDPRLLVRVPDGEIEDLGTTFRVTVRDGMTRELAVSEGRVLFRRRGAAALQLLAGSTWTAPAEQPSASSTDEPVAPPRAEQQLPVARPRPLVPRTQARERDHADAPSAQADSAAREDAAYLHIIALLREGRADEARLSAFAYLREFPAGFRRREVGRVTDLPAVDAGRLDPRP